MRRITLWLAATLAVVAMATYYQVSLSGDGKADDRPPAAQTTTGAPATSSSKPADDRPGGTPDDHSGKPGESKTG